MNLASANDKALYLRYHPMPRDQSDIPYPSDPGDMTCWICLRSLDDGSVRRRMVHLCSRHARQDLGLFYMRMTDTGLWQTFPGEE